MTNLRKLRLNKKVVVQIDKDEYHRFRRNPRRTKTLILEIDEIKENEYGIKQLGLNKYDNEIEVYYFCDKLFFKINTNLYISSESRSLDDYNCSLEEGCYKCLDLKNYFQENAFSQPIFIENFYKEIEAYCKCGKFLSQYKDGCSIKFCSECSAKYIIDPYMPKVYNISEIAKELLEEIPKYVKNALLTNIIYRAVFVTRLDLIEAVNQDNVFALAITDDEFKMIVDKWLAIIEANKKEMLKNIILELRK